MKKVKTSVRRVLVALPLEGESSRRHLEGVFTYVRAHGGMTLEVVRSSLAMTPETLRERIRAGLDGAIVLTWRFDSLLETLLAADVPTVALSFHDDVPERFRTASFVRVLCDNAACGRAAAAHFLRAEAAFRSFAYIPWETEEGWSVARGAAFAKALSARRRTCAAWTRDTSLVSFLRQLPKPAAVFAVNDVTAFAVEEACAGAGIRMPAEVAVLGMDNDTLFCEHAPVALSTVEPDWERGGYLAAEALSRLMRGLKSPSDRMFPFRRTVVRASTESLPFVAADAVARAIAFVDAHALEPVRVTDVVAASGRSRRYLEKAFRLATGESILEALRTRRLREACRLLKNTRRSVAEIAALTGFQTANAFARSFREAQGCSPNAYRARLNVTFRR